MTDLQQHEDEHHVNPKRTYRVVPDAYKEFETGIRTFFVFGRGEATLVQGERFYVQHLHEGSKIIQFEVTTVYPRKSGDRIVGIKKVGGDEETFTLKELLELATAHHNIARRLAAETSSTGKTADGTSFVVAITEHVRSAEAYMKVHSMLRKHRARGREIGTWRK